jgi:hypothetical protein
MGHYHYCVLAVDDAFFRSVEDDGVQLQERGPMLARAAKHTDIAYG